jgi:uncharacterized delta-60 repeat protein
MISNSKGLSRARAPKGVLTHEFFNALRRIAASLFFIALVFAGNNFAQGTQSESSPGILDLDFNAQISTASYSAKTVDVVLPLPDGKILVAGKINSYNGIATGAVVRLNPNGSLDTSFNCDVIMMTTSEFGFISALAVQPDGKILVSGVFKLNSETPTPSVVRLNADGSLDPSFSFNGTTGQYGARRILVRSNGKILISGDSLTLPSGRVEGIFQLNSDGSVDVAFDSGMSTSVSYIEFQNDKILALTGSEIARLNDDGSFDSSFNRRNFNFTKAYVLSDGKIIGLRANAFQLIRLNADGTDDATLQSSQHTIYHAAVQPDGRIVVAGGHNGQKVSRLLSNGALDPSFAVFSDPSLLVNALALQTDGKILIGDQMFSSTPVNFFIRFNQDGTRDSSFNTGIGFQLLAPGRVSGFAVQPDNKVIIGGKFDRINNTSRYCLARLNENGSIDDSFQVSTIGANRFTQIYEIHNLALQSDGKVIVSGAFSYTVNGETKTDFARLNADGSIDTSYNLAVRIVNFAAGTNAGKNKVIMRPNNNSLVGNSRNGGTASNIIAPVMVNEDGSPFAGFNSAYRTEATLFLIFDIFVQPDGKIVIGGRYDVPNGPGAFISKGFVARMNSDGSLDSSFRTIEEDGKVVKALTPLADGKILIAKAQFPTEANSEVVRLNPNGTVDSTFKVGAANGKINALLPFADDKILVGGKFTQFYDQPRRNLAVLNANGTLNETLLNVNQEVLSLMADNQGRVLIGGAFTSISTGGGTVSRSYLARLNAEPESSSAKPRFDFDGDGRSDLALFNQTTGIWTIRSSRTNQTISTHFGKNGDITAPADYDNDGKTDIAVYRPTEGMWYLQQSTAGFKAVRWGLAEDKPVAADYDGDGRTDIAVFRPSSRIWYILQSSDNQMRAVYFGLATDVLLREVDFDGDGKADIAVYRPSNGGWYWQASGSNNEFRAAQWGASNDIPVAADYNGDGKTDIAVYRPSDGVWYQQLSTESGNYNFAAVQFGLNGDVPVVADYNGDGKADISIRRGEIWALLLSVQGYNGLNFGNASDKAVAAVQP